MIRTIPLAGFVLLLGTAIPSYAQQSNTTQQTDDTVTVSCEEIWSQVDSDGDGSVSQQEASAKLDAAFSAIDENGDGNISQTEYKECLVQSTDNSGDWPTKTAN